MGSYRSVHATRPCERCGTTLRVEVQFKTDHDDLQTYEEGQIVAPDAGMRTGDVYEGTAFRYCEPCTRTWIRDDRTAHANALAEQVEAGNLKIRHRNGGPFYTALQLREHAVDTSRLQLAQPLGEDEEAPVFSVRQATPYEIVWKGRKTAFPGGAWREYMTTIFQAVDAALKAEGWTYGRDFIRENLEVFLDEDSRIRVRTPNEA